MAVQGITMAEARAESGHTGKFSVDHTTFYVDRQGFVRADDNRHPEYADKAGGYVYFLPTGDYPGAFLWPVTASDGYTEQAASFTGGYGTFRHLCYGYVNRWAELEVSNVDTTRDVADFDRDDR